MGLRCCVVCVGNMYWNNYQNRDWFDVDRGTSKPYTCEPYSIGNVCFISHRPEHISDVSLSLNEYV